MPKQTLEVEVPEGWELTGEYRTPKLGEYFINSKGAVFQCSPNHLSTPKPIVRRSWQWPEWLKAGWIAMDKSGSWFAFEECPKLRSDIGFWQSGQSQTGYSKLDERCFNFTPPPCDDWTQSLRKNPNL